MLNKVPGYWILRKINSRKWIVEEQIFFKEEAEAMNALIKEIKDTPNFIYELDNVGNRWVYTKE
jgi:hypothetical protein